MHAEAPDPTADSSGETPPPTILVVDDEQAFCDVVCEILESFGYLSQQAHNATQALTLLDEFIPDLILTDVMMPDIDGLSFIHAIRTQRRLTAIPIVVVSAKATPDDHDIALLAGANAFLAKPFSSRELHRIVSSFLES